MPNITAYLTIGKVEPTEGFVPTHWAYLIEGTRPVWYIAPAGLFSDYPKFKSTWLTSHETVVDDAMAMVATVVEELPSVAEIVSHVTDHAEGETVDLGQLLNPARRRLSRLNQTTTHDARLVVTVLSDSIVSGEMHNFIKYPIHVEICTASYGQDGSMANFKRQDLGDDGTSLSTLELN